MFFLLFYISLEHSKISRKRDVTFDLPPFQKIQNEGLVSFFRYVGERKKKPALISSQFQRHIWTIAAVIPMLVVMR